MQSEVESARELRPRGLWVLAALVVSGVGVTAGYLQWRAPEIRENIAATARAVRAAPDSTAGRLANWVAYGAPLIHQRLQQMRLSPERPWLVTHAVGRSAEQADLGIYGVDLSEMPLHIAHLEGESVRVRLPKPRFLGRGALTDAARAFVPVYAEDVRGTGDVLGTDLDSRLHQLAEFALGDLGRALERDIPGARFAIDVGPEVEWSK